MQLLFRAQAGQIKGLCCCCCCCCGLSTGAREEPCRFRNRFSLCRQILRSHLAHAAHHLDGNSDVIGFFRGRVLTACRTVYGGFP